MRLAVLGEEAKGQSQGMLTPVSRPGGPSGQLPVKAQIHKGILRLPAIEPSDQGQYLCRALSSAGQHVARAMLQVHGERAGLEVGMGVGEAQRGILTGVLSVGGNGPRVQVSPERTQVHEGRTVRLYCRAAGVPSASITWRKEGGSLPPQVSQPGCPNRDPAFISLSLHAGPSPNPGLPEPPSYLDSILQSLSHPTHPFVTPF